MKLKLENIIELAVLSFQDDQSKFAHFSGDRNPIHLDQKSAKKSLAGECIVHGMNLLLMALEIYLKNSNLLQIICDIKFKNPVSVGKPIRLILDKDKNQLRWENNSATICCVIKISNQEKIWDRINDASLSKMKILSKPSQNEDY